MHAYANAKRPSVVDWPLYWFAALERAIESSNFSAAADAQRNLERLGVTVRFSSQPGKRIPEEVGVR